MSSGGNEAEPVENFYPAGGQVPIPKANPQGFRSRKPWGRWPWAPEGGVSTPPFRSYFVQKLS
jgi:hypothetical protein